MTTPTRKPYHQMIDYRIFVVTCYHKEEITDDLIASLSSQAIVEKRYSPDKKYLFVKYSIDEYVKNFNISRSIEGDPAHLQFSIFPVYNAARKEHTFYYKRGYVRLPVFRRMDYIEVQVAEIRWTTEEERTRATEIAEFRKVVTYDNTAKDRYTNKDICKYYKVRFRGFIHEITEDDYAEGGMSMSIRAASMLYFLANTPYITNLAMFSSTFFETQRSHILPNQYIVLYGNLLQDLRDTVSRTKTMLEEAFGVDSNSTVIEREARSLGGDSIATKEFINAYYVSKPKKTFNELFNDVLKQLDIDQPNKTKGTQATLIPLAELYFARVDNYFGEDSLYRLYSSQVFDMEIQFTGENTEFISNFTYLLQVLNQFKESVEYLLYEEADGTIVFDRPRYAELPNVLVTEDEYISYEYSESTTGYYTEVFTTPGTALKILDDQIKETFFKTSGYTLDQLRRFGYRRPEPINNPNIMVPEALEMYAKTKKALNNAALTELRINLGYNNEIDVSKTLLFRKKFQIGFVTEVTERIEYGGQSTTDVNMAYLRRITGIKKDMPIENIELSNKYDIIIEDFPEYTFASDFYGARIRVSDQTKEQNKKERSIL